jgi:hypothetical protein
VSGKVLTHDDGDDRQWTLFEVVSGLVLMKYMARSSTGIVATGQRGWHQIEVRLTENSSGSIVTGESGLAHTRTRLESVQIFHNIRFAMVADVLRVMGGGGGRYYFGVTFALQDAGCR